MANLHEECGVFGVYSPKPGPVADLAYYGLYALQHRGQESCGIVVNDDGVFASRKDIGLVNEVFSRDDLMKFPQGRMAVAHARYGTTGGNSRANCQPIEVNHQKGKMALAHNGNLSNAYELRSELELGGAIFHTTSDTEVISYIITKERLTSGSIEEAVNRAMDKLKGAYSLVIMSPSKLIAARDEHGFRPLCYGQTADDRLRRMCGRITPGKRLAVILVMFFFFGGLSIYITVSSIYNIGKRDGRRLQIEHIRQLPLHGNDTTKSINPLNRPQYGRSTEE